MSIHLHRLAAAVAAGVLLAPAAVEAKPGNGKGHAFGHAKHGVPAPHAVPAEAAPTPAGVTSAKRATKRATARKAPKLQTFVLRGAVTAVDAAAGTVEVAVTAGNAFGRRFAGETVLFDASAAVVEGVETDGVAGLTLADVLAGDAVTVQARLARTARPDGTTVVARKVADRADRDPAPVAEPTPDPVVTEPAA